MQTGTTPGLPDFLASSSRPSARCATNSSTHQPKVKSDAPHTHHLTPSPLHLSMILRDPTRVLPKTFARGMFPKTEEMRRPHPENQLPTPAIPAHPGPSSPGTRSAHLPSPHPLEGPSFASSIPYSLMVVAPSDPPAPLHPRHHANSQYIPTNAASAPDCTHSIRNALRPPRTVPAHPVPTFPLTPLITTSNLPATS